MRTLFLLTATLLIYSFLNATPNSNFYSSIYQNSLLFHEPKAEPEFSTVELTDPTISAQLKSAFDTASIDLNALAESLELGSLTSEDIDFVNLQRVSVVGQIGETIVASFKSNSPESNINYAFAMFIDDGANLIRPTIVKSDAGTRIKYFLLNSDLVIQIDNVDDKMAISSYQTSYRTRGTWNCGQQVMNCFQDAYQNHGWLSVWITVQSFVIPQTAGGILAVCAVKNCALAG